MLPPPCFGHFPIGAALFALPPPCSHSCCRALLSPRPPLLAQLIKPSLAQPGRAHSPVLGSTPAGHRIQRCASFYLCSCPSLVDCYACFSAKAPAPLLQATGSLSTHGFPFSCMLRAPRMRCSPALTACRPMFSSAAHLWQLAACVSFQSHLHPYSRGARPFHLTAVFSAAPCQARPSLDRDLHAVGCRPTLKLQ